MGAVLQTAGVAELAAEVTCCACSSICGLAARDGATRAKFRYCSFLLLATVTCVIALIPGLRAKLDKIPNLCNKVFSPDTCDTFVGFSAVYRILFAMAVFHFILSILTVKVTRVKSFRARFNNGLWMFKLGLIFGLTIATFYIPKRTGFFRIWMYLSLTGGFMFVMFQIILVIDFGHSWSLSWAEKLETGNTKLWYFAVGLTTFFMFAISFGAILTFYAYFTRPPSVMKCHANFFYISFMTIQCIIATVISVTPSVQNQLPGAGLLQSSVVILYALYLTWNTLSSEPDSLCNPLGNIILEYDSFTGLSGEAIFGCLLTLALLMFACTVRADTSHLGKYGLALAESEHFALATYHEDRSKEKVETQLEDGNKEILLSEYVGYNYSFFHIIMSIASLHILMVLTNWHSPEENSNMKTLVKNWVSVWVQMASSFSCVLMYVWFLVTPLVKRVWGPVFGIELDDVSLLHKNYPDSIKSYKRKPSDDKIKTKHHNEVSTSKYPQDKQTVPAITNQPVPTSPTGKPFDVINRAASRNTYCPSEISFAQQQQQVLHLLPSQKQSFSTKRLLQNLSNESVNHSLHQSALKNASVIGKPPRIKLYCADEDITNNTLLNNPDRHARRKEFPGKQLHRLTQHEHMNTSIESINSWVSNSYRRKYQPFVTRDQHQKDDVIYNKLAPIYDQSVENEGPNYTKVPGTKCDTTPQKVKTKHKQHEFDETPSRKRIPPKPRLRTNRSKKDYHNDTSDYSTATLDKHKPKYKRDKLQNRKYLTTQSTISATALNKEDTFSRPDDSSDSSSYKSRKKKKKKRKTKINKQTQQSEDSDLDKNDVYRNTDTKKLYKTTKNSFHADKTTNIQHDSFLGNRDKLQATQDSKHTKTRPPASSSFVSRKYRSSSALYTKIKTQSDSPQNSTSKFSPAKNDINAFSENLDKPKHPVASTSHMNNIKLTELPSTVKTKAVSQDISLVPSVFKRKPQDSDTANELLKLQWKILRTQAKIVKIQERIYRLQSNVDNDVDLKAKASLKRQNDSQQLHYRIKTNDTFKEETNYKKRRRKSISSVA